MTTRLGFEPSHYLKGFLLGIVLSQMNKKQMKLCFSAGILFSTLVFGPACGFILGSLCTKFYVDAIFIDTSELLLFLCVSYVSLSLSDVCTWFNAVHLYR